jgi:RIO kinase 1
MTVRELFDFVVSDYESLKSKVSLQSVADDEELVLDEYLHSVHLLTQMDETLQERPSNYLESDEVQANEAVFKQVYIPRTLDEIGAPLQELERAQHDDGILYEAVAGLQTTDAPQYDTSSDSESSEGSHIENEDAQSTSEEEWTQIEKPKSNLKKDEDKDSKKLRKAQVKEEKREKRKTKIPKAEKKRKQKLASNK